MTKGLECTYVKKFEAKIVEFIIRYRSRATNGRSQLVAAPLSFQAKTHFLYAFYVVII